MSWPDSDKLSVSASPRSPRMRWWPRTIRWQMLVGLALLEALSIALFALLLVQFQQHDLRDRVHLRLIHEVTSLSLQAEESFLQNKPDWAALSVRMMGDSPSVLHAKLSDNAGNVLVASAGDSHQAPLDAAEKAELSHLPEHEATLFALGGRRWEAAKRVYVGSQLRGVAWVESDPLWDDEQILGTVRATVVFGVVWIAASFVLVWLSFRLISRPLAVLHSGTRALMSMPDGNGRFPLPVIVHNEFGELIEAFNRMVASLDEQRSGLNDTLSLLDSMLANAPVGLAFFDRHCRFVRVNQMFADLTCTPLSRHLGRTLPELFPEEAAQPLELALRRVFAEDDEARELELSGVDPDSRIPWTWLISVYPVRTSPNQVRWAGIILRDVSERVRAEEALRKTEKLAATGRLAASIAHEINNPLEALTNLLFLLRNFSGLNEGALHYVSMAEHEARRIAEIAQQTLRFYRQSTSPQRTKMAELIDSVLDLYRSRLNTLDIDVRRDYDPEMTLFCFSGEIRQVFANLVGNAVDAIPGGGRLVVRARRSRSWKEPEKTGVRFAVADTGSGMDSQVRDRIFEAFFTTKEDTGTGLGLWVSYEIILKHRGLIRVRSRSSRDGGGSSGTVFQIFLPDDENLTQIVRPAISDTPQAAQPA